MPAETAYSTKYTFRIEIEGQQAADQAKMIQEAIEKMMAAATAETGTPAVAKDLESLIGVTTELAKNISSMTRRWSYHVRRLEEVSAALRQVVADAAAVPDAFQGIVASAQQMYDRLVGHSLLPEIQEEWMAVVRAMRQQTRELEEDVAKGLLSMEEADRRYLSHLTYFVGEYMKLMQEIGRYPTALPSIGVMGRTTVEMRVMPEFVEPEAIAAGHLVRDFIHALVTETPWGMIASTVVGQLLILPGILTIPERARGARGGFMQPVEHWGLYAPLERTVTVQLLDKFGELRSEAALLQTSIHETAHAFYHLVRTFEPLEFARLAELWRHQMQFGVTTASQRPARLTTGEYWQLEEGMARAIQATMYATLPTEVFEQFSQAIPETLYAVRQYEPYPGIVRPRWIVEEFFPRFLEAGDKAIETLIRLAPSGERFDEMLDAAAADVLYLSEAAKEATRALVPMVQLYRGLRLPEGVAPRLEAPGEWWTTSIQEALQYAIMGMRGRITGEGGFIPTRGTILGAQLPTFAAQRYAEGHIDELTKTFQYLPGALQKALTAVRELTDKEIALAIVRERYAAQIAAGLQDFQQAGARMANLGVLLSRLGQLEAPREALYLPQQRAASMLTEETQALVPTGWSAYWGQMAKPMDLMEVFLGAQLQIKDALVAYAEQVGESVTQATQFDFTSLEIGRPGVWTAGDELAVLLESEFSALFPLIGKWSVDAIATAFRQVMAIGYYTDEISRLIPHERWVQLVVDWLEQGLITQFAEPAHFEVYGGMDLAEWWKHVPGYMAGYLGESPLALPPPRVLDIGAGPPTEDFRRFWMGEGYLPEGTLRITAVDIDPSVVDAALGDVVADVRALPFASGVFSEVIAGFMLREIAETFDYDAAQASLDIQQAMQEMLRVTVPGGLISVVDFEQLMSPVRYALEAGAESVSDTLVNEYLYQWKTGREREADWMTQWRRLGDAVRSEAQGLEPFLLGPDWVQQAMPMGPLYPYPPLTPAPQIAGLLPAPSEEALASARAQAAAQVEKLTGIEMGHADSLRMLSDAELEAAENAEILEAEVTDISEKIIGPRAGRKGYIPPAPDTETDWIYSAEKGWRRAEWEAMGGGRGGRGGRGGGIGWEWEWAAPDPYRWRMFYREATKGAQEATGWTERFGKALNEATMQYFGIRRVGYGLQATGSQIGRVGQQMIGTLQTAAQEYWDFNEVSTRAAAAMELDIQLRDELSRAIIENARALGFFDPSEIAEGLRKWAAGTGVVVRTEQELHAVIAQTVDVQKMALLNNANLGDSMRITGAIMKSFGMNVEDVTHITEVLNFVAAKTFAEVTDVGSAFEMVGPVAAQMGVSFEELAATIALLSEEGLKGQRTGRALRQMFIQLSEPTKAQKELMEELLGVGWSGVIFPEGEFIGIASFIDLLASRTENLTKAERAEALAILSTANELPTLTALVENQIEAREHGINVVRAFTKSMMGQVDAEVLAYREFVEMQTGIPFSLESAHALMTDQWEKYEKSDAFRAAQMEQRWKAAMLKLGEAISDPLLSAMETFAEFAEDVLNILAEHPGWLQIGLALGGILVVLSKIVAVSGTLAHTWANILILRGAFQGLAAQQMIMGGMMAPVGKELLGMPAMITGGLRAGGVSAMAGGKVGTVISALSGIAAPAIAVAGALTLLYIAADASRREFEAQQERDLEAARTEAQYMRLREQAGALRPVPTDEAGRRWGLARSIRDEQVTRERQVWAIEASIRAIQEFTGELEGVDPHDLWAYQMAVAELVMRGMQEDWEEIRRYREQGYQAPEGGLWPDWEGGAVAGPSTDALARYLQMVEDVAEAEADYRDDVTEAWDDYYADIADMDDDFHKRRDKMIRDYAKEEARRLEDHQESLQDMRDDAMEDIAEEEQRMREKRQEAEDDLNKRIQERYEDHLKDLRRMRLDHEWRMEELIRERDARGVLEERRAYARRVSEANEDYNDWVRRQRENFQDEQGDLEKHIEEMKKKRLEDLQDKLDEAEENYQKAKDRRDEDFQEQLDDLAENLQDQKDERWDAHEDALDDLEAQWQEKKRELETEAGEELAVLIGLIDDRETYIKNHHEELMRDMNEFLYGGGVYGDGWLAAQQRMFEAGEITAPEMEEYFSAIQAALGAGVPIEYIIQQLRAGVTDPYAIINRWFGYAMQAGGYAPYGPYVLGEAGTEFVMSAPTTRAYERALGPLSQERMLAALGGGGSRSGGIVVEVNQRNWTFAGSFTAADKAWFSEVARRSAVEELTTVLKGMRR